MYLNILLFLINDLYIKLYKKLKTINIEDFKIKDI